MYVSDGWIFLKINLCWKISSKWLNMVLDEMIGLKFQSTQLCSITFIFNTIHLIGIQQWEYVNTIARFYSYHKVRLKAESIHLNLLSFLEHLSFDLQTISGLLPFWLDIVTTNYFDFLLPFFRRNYKLSNWLSQNICKYIYK